MTVYCDTSAVLKLAVHEPESDALAAHLSSAIAGVTSALCLADVTQALRRTALSRQDVEAALAGFHLLHVTNAILEQAGWMTGDRLGTLDAIHLASAMSLGLPDLQFISYDEGVIAAARAARLRVAQPGRATASL
jgi:uncharacterized protein